MLSFIMYVPFFFIERHLNKIRFFKQRSGSLYLHNLMHITIKKKQLLTGLTLKAAIKLFLILFVKAVKSGSRQVIIDIPAVTFRTMWCAAVRMRVSSGSKAKS